MTKKKKTSMSAVRREHCNGAAVHGWKNNHFQPLLYSFLEVWIILPCLDHHHMRDFGREFNFLPTCLFCHGFLYLQPWYIVTHVPLPVTTHLTYLLFTCTNSTHSSSSFVPSIDLDLNRCMVPPRLPTTFFFIEDRGPYLTYSQLDNQIKDIIIVYYL